MYNILPINSVLNRATHPRSAGQVSYKSGLQELYCVALLFLAFLAVLISKNSDLSQYDRWAKGRGGEGKGLFDEKLDLASISIILLLPSVFLTEAFIKLYVRVHVSICHIYRPKYQILRHPFPCMNLDINPCIKKPPYSDHLPPLS